MNEHHVKRNRLLGERMVKALESRNIKGYYAENREEALRIALKLIPEGSIVAKGGSMTLEEIGLTAALAQGNYSFYDRDAVATGEEKQEAERKAYDSDFFLSSANAITEDGIIVNIDANANRISAIAYGPRKVLFVVGMNKVTKDVDSAIKRARNEAAPSNTIRFGMNVPCAKEGTCFNCKSPDTLCCQFLITRYALHPERMHVILVDEALGF